jgi:hypothetical protein
MHTKVPEEHLERSVIEKQEQGEHRHHQHRRILRWSCSVTTMSSRLVARKIDKFILPPLFWVYFLQILDKSCVGYGANFGLQTEAVRGPLLIIALTDRDVAPRWRSILFDLLFRLLGPGRFLLCSQPSSSFASPPDSS